MGAIVSLVKSVGDGVGSFIKGEQDRKAYQAKAREEIKQAELMEERQNAAIAEGSVKARRRTKQLAQDQGAARAGFAGNGIVVEDYGTVADVMSSQEIEAQEDVNAIVTKAGNEADTYYQNALAHRETAKNYFKQALYARINGVISLVTAGAVSGSSMASSAWDWKSGTSETSSDGEDDSEGVGEIQYEAGDYGDGSSASGWC